MPAGSTLWILEGNQDSICRLSIPLGNPPIQNCCSYICIRSFVVSHSFLHRRSIRRILTVNHRLIYVHQQDWNLEHEDGFVFAVSQETTSCILVFMWLFVAVLGGGFTGFHSVVGVCVCVWVLGTSTLQFSPVLIVRNSD